MREVGNELYLIKGHEIIILKNVFVFEEYIKKTIFLYISYFNMKSKTLSDIIGSLN